MKYLRDKPYFHHIWLIFAAYGVWFAIISGIEEMVNGKFWKVGLCLGFGFISYIYVEYILYK